jgi:hypothetical protein
MNFRTLKGPPPENTDALERVFARFPDQLTVFLDREGGGDLLIADRETGRISERLFMGVSKAWLEQSELAPILERAAARFGACATKYPPGF